MRDRIMNDPHYAYITWFNDFLTIKYFAEYFELDIQFARKIIAKGREINQSL